MKKVDKSKKSKAVAKAKTVKKAPVKSKKDSPKKAKASAKKADVKGKVAVKKTAIKKPIEKKKVEKIKAVKPVKPLKKEAKTTATKPSKVVAKKAVSKIKEKSEKKSKKEDLDDDDILLDMPTAKTKKRSKGGRKRKNKDDDDDEPMIEQDILLEQLINNTKMLRSGKSKEPKQIRTFINPKTSLSVVEDTSSKKKPAKEPKGKFVLEYVTRTSAGILYEFLTTPSGLSEWFADDVNINEGVFTFFWDGSEQKAKLLGFKEEQFIKFQWLDKPEGSYFEFRIEKDDLTGDISLLITDFADEDSDYKTSKLLWDSQINDLLNVLGSY